MPERGTDRADENARGDTDTMTIAEVSKNYEISADTLRYYERIGLLPPVPRTKSGIRVYDEDSLKWIQLMKCMRKAGVQIEALVEYVALFEQGTETVNARKNILVEQRAQLLERMKDLQESLDLLDSKIEHYEQVLVPAQESLRRPEDVETKKGA